MKEIDLKKHRVIEEKLAPFGFVNGEYTEKISDGQFELKLTADGGRVYSSLIEIAFGEEYVLHLVEGAQGEFVGAVRAAYNSVIEKFIADCCEKQIYKSPQTQEVIAYARRTYGDELEFLWDDDNSVLRRKDTALWYAVIMPVSRKRLGLDTDEVVELIDMRIRPEELDGLADGRKYFRGYHMNKKSWLTVILDGSVPTEEILNRLDESYRLAKKK